jgi:hypothetical protein
LPIHLRPCATVTERQTAKAESAGAPARHIPAAVFVEQHVQRRILIAALAIVVFLLHRDDSAHDSSQIANKIPRPSLSASHHRFTLQLRVEIPNWHATGAAGDYPVDAAVESGG